jgi:carboxymethylenebutenolidase
MLSKIVRFDSSWALIAMIVASTACTTRRIAPADHDHQMESAGQIAAATMATPRSADGLPPNSANVAQRLATSPRHGEWAMIKTGPSDSVRAWVVYPERSSKAPVVVVIHEIFGLSTWIRGVADQLAADGYIAIAPDLLTGKGQLQGDSLPYSVATAAIRTLKREDVQRQLAAVGRYGMSLPAALPKYGIVGFCWGGGTSFAHAVSSPEGLGASVVYYGTSPASAELSSVKVPVLGLYGGDDARVNATIPAADSTMKALGRTYEPHIFAGAGHGFLRSQDLSNGTNPPNPANLTATKQAWPLTVGWFRKYLGA